MEDHVQINRKAVDQFYAKAKESLIAFSATLTDTINKITKFSSEELALEASAFLKLTSQIRRLYGYFTDYTWNYIEQEEEKKDRDGQVAHTESFDWLFLENIDDIPYQP